MATPAAAKIRTNTSGVSTDTMLLSHLGSTVIFTKLTTGLHFDRKSHMYASTNSA